MGARPARAIHVDGEHVLFRRPDLLQDLLVGWMVPIQLERFAVRQAYDEGVREALPAARGWQVTTGRGHNAPPATGGVAQGGFKGT